MREFHRIPRMCLEIAYLWQKYCPDWRLGQLAFNFYRWYGKDPFYVEDEDFIELIRQFFKENFNEQ